MSSRQQPMSKRSPSILVTDARHGAHSTAPFVRSGGFARDKRRPKTKTQGTGGQYGSTSMMNPQASGHFTGRLDSISIDNILSDVSEIPSAQRRYPYPQNSNVHRRQQQQQQNQNQNQHQQQHIDPTGDTSSSDMAGKSKGKKKPSSTVRLPPRLTPTIQGRTTKLSEKLVLIPDEEPGFHFDDDDDDDDEYGKPPRAKSDTGRREEQDTTGRRRSYAERLPKDRRTDQFGRVTAYCISDGIRLKVAAEFLRNHHRIRPRIYDEALFAPYYLPLLPGETSRVKSSPGGLAHMERLINESEQGDHHYEYFSGEETNQVDVPESHDGWKDGEEEFDPSEPQHFTPPENKNSPMLSPTDGEREETGQQEEEGRGDGNDDPIARTPSPPLDPQEEEIAEFVKQTDDSNTSEPPPLPDEKHAEIFIFTYGVIVFWNFSERQEKDVLADLMFAKVAHHPSSALASTSSIRPPSAVKPLVVRPIDDQDIETEELHFTYFPETSRPRIYNDMITLKSGDHMIKLAMSHAIAQSTKLSRFEARMDVNMHDVKHVPKMLALTGKLGLKREEILKISGKLFKLRVDVNLSSNVLDTPEFFWEDEPSLNPLYTAVREYLEIEQRILVLNERCKVFLELTDIIADSIAEGNMSRITWIIIILIALSLGVSMLEIFIRFAILSGRE